MTNVKDEVEDAIVNSWTSKLTQLEGNVNVYRREVRRRISDFNSQAAPSSQSDNVTVPIPTAANHSPQQMDLVSLSTLAQEQLTFDQNKVAKEKRLATSKAKCSITTIKHDLEDLTSEYAEFPDWQDVEDGQIQRAMGCVKSWKEKYSRVKREIAQLVSIVEGEALDDLNDEVSRLKMLVDKTGTELQTAISTIKEADKDKGLFTDQKERTTPLPFPVFSGNPNEDYVEFETKFEKAVVANKISKSDQLEKLREQLRGKAKNQVPAKTDSIERAWELLKSAFGDPMILLRYRKQSLSKLGPYPESQAKNNPQKLVDWCLDLERIIDDLIKLGERDTRLEMTAFNDDTINDVIDLFPMRLIFRIEKLENHGKEKLEEIVNILEEERKVLQRLALRPSNSTRKPVKAECDEKNSRGYKVSTVQPKGLSLFSNPRKLSTCRICKELEKRGDNRDLYESHYGNYPTHCPRWAALRNEERNDVAKAAKYCLMCMDPKVTYSANMSGARHKCVTTSTKNRFSCTNAKCCFHSWVCLRHKEENKELLDKFAAELAKKNMVFVHLTDMCPILDAPTFPGAGFTSPGEPCNDPRNEHDIAHLGTAATNAKRTKPPDSTDSSPSSISIPQAIEKLKKLTPSGEELMTKLKDPPLFMFSSIPGRHSNVQIFYDSGNSHVLFKEGTPQNLYGVMIRPGPFPLGAVGDTTVWGGSEWACQPMTTRGHREILIGVTVPKITSNFPYVNLKEATLELKNSAPENEELQALTVPEYVGGECQILLGIQYAAHFPRLVHSLDSGLGIYRVKLQPSSPHYTAAIAGPHHSFNFLAGKLGNVAHLLQKFTEGIEYWKVHGAPAPKSISLTQEELREAYFHNTGELIDCLPPDLDDAIVAEKESSVICLSHAALKCDGQAVSQQTSRDRILTDTRDDLLDSALPKSRLHTGTRHDILEDESDLDELAPCGWFEATRRGMDQRFSAGEECTRLACYECSEVALMGLSEGRQFLNDYYEVLEKSSQGETICIDKDYYKIFNTAISQDAKKENSILKQFISANEAPIRIDYRCPKCRSCSSCRDALETEKISLREEAEEAEIKASVQLDFENKMFKCKLPLRGKVEDFLCSNKSSALKILDRQSKLYAKDPPTKDLIVASMQKLFDRGHFQLLKDLPKSLQDMIISQPIKYYIPWRVCFKPNSLSTPCRPVFDCSSRTPYSPDGKGGRCLNDLMAKGRYIALDLIRMLLRFSIGTYAISSDIRQFYNCFKLIPEHWHLQLFLWRDDMDPDKEALTAVIKTLIYGNRASAPQSEEGMRQLAEVIKDENPRLASFFTDSRYVDDLNDSESSEEKLENLQRDAVKILGMLNVELKGWARSGKAPDAEISADGSIGVAGMSWEPLIDSLQVKIGNLHFGSVVRGRLSAGTKVFEGKFGTFDEMNDFVPSKLTKRMIVSKFMGVYDPLGNLLPLTSRMKKDLRLIMKSTPNWDDAVTDEHRKSWVKNFLDIEKAKGLKYTRPRMPIDAIDTKMRLMVFVDAAKELLVIWAGVGFKRKTGEWSSAFLIGRSLLCPQDSTIPRDELEALVAGSNMLWLLRQILEQWVDSFLLAGDAMIPLFWVLSDKKRLGIWHRTRSVQVRRGTPMENIYHVQTAYNVADGPTRPDKLTFEDVGPGTPWEIGLPWMSMDLDKIIEQKILTPIQELMMNDEDKEEFEEGFVIERTPDVLTRGHFGNGNFSLQCNSSKRVDLVASRANYSKYIILPTKYSFSKVVRILSLVAKFVRAFKCKWSKKFASQLPTRKVTRFQVFSICPTGQSYLDTTKNDLFTSEVPADGPFCASSSYHGIGGKPSIKLDDEDIQDSLQYFYTTAAKELTNFNKPEEISKIGAKRDGIWYHKTRILEGQRFLQCGGFEGMDVLNAQGINVLCPLIDRWSPLAYAIGDHVHTAVAKHSGAETCLRISHSFVFIMRGFSLFKEIGDDCTACKKLNRRFIEASMGPIHSSKFTVAPPFWAAQCDIWGPIPVFVPGREKNTRSSAALSAKVYALVFVCLVTKLTNIQIIETKDVNGICDGLTRLTCEVGAPSKLFIDQETSLMKALKEGEIELLSLENMARKKVQIDFSVCPVSGHNAHGLVEAKIRLAQVGFEKSGAGSLRLHATGAQTLCKLIETDLNNSPFGVTAGRGESNTPLLKLLSPQQMRMGRINARSPIGPFKLPTSPKSMLDRVESCYKLWYRAYQDTLLEKYLVDLQPKWFKSDRDTQVHDCVLFRKQEGKLLGPWQLGMVDEVIRSPDGIIRRVVIRYNNAEENLPRFTDRSVRSVVKLFNVDEETWKDDMKRVQKMLAAVDASVHLEGSSDTELNALSGNPVLNYSNSSLASPLPRNDAAVSAPVKEGVICRCCCASHHAFTYHSSRPGNLKLEMAVPPILSSLHVPEEDASEDRLLDALQNGIHSSDDCFLSQIGALGVDMSSSAYKL